MISLNSSMGSSTSDVVHAGTSSPDEAAMLATTAPSAAMSGLTLVLGRERSGDVTGGGRYQTPVYSRSRFFFLPWLTDPPTQRARRPLGKW